MTVRYRPDELELEVVDDGVGAAASDGLGHGLVGIRERVKIYGGEMTAGPHPAAASSSAHACPSTGSSMSIRVLVADDQSMVRAGFRMLLSGEPDIEVVAEASNGLEAVDKATRFRPTVVLMDIRMPELDGLEATRRILAADDTTRILILTTFDLDEYVYEALRAGASGFVLKDDPPEQLLAAIRIVARGEALLSPAITKRVIEQFTRIPHPSAAKSARRPHRTRTRRLPPDRPRPLKRRDRPTALHQRHHRQDPHHPHPPETQPPRPRPSRRARPRNRPSSPTSTRQAVATNVRLTEQLELGQNTPNAYNEPG